MSYFSIKNAELYDDLGNKLENYNYVNAYLDFLE